MEKSIFAYLLSFYCSIIPPFQWAFGRKNLEAQPKFKVPYKILVMYVIEIAFLSPVFDNNDNNNYEYSYWIKHFNLRKAVINLCPVNLIRSNLSKK